MGLKGQMGHIWTALDAQRNVKAHVSGGRLSVLLSNVNCRPHPDCLLVSYVLSPP